MQNENISTTIHTGDAGWPHDVEISVDYVEEGGVIFVHASEESGDTPDNPSEVWWETIKERIEDHFYPLIVKFL